MDFSIRLIAVLAICTAIVGCSSPQPSGEKVTPTTGAPDSEASSQEETPHDLGELHPTMQEIILAWYDSEDHGDEVRILTVIDEDRDDLEEATTDIAHLELLERRVDPDDAENHCYEGVVYVEVRDSQVSSVGRYGHDCCPEIDCEMGPKNWMGRLFDRSRDGDIEGVRQLIHPDDGIFLEESWSDRDEEQYSGSAEFHLTASEFPGERGEEFLSCGPNFMPGFEFSCQDLNEGFRCSCHVPGIVTRFTWQWLDGEAYLVEITRAWHE